MNPSWDDGQRPSSASGRGLFALPAIDRALGLKALLATVAARHCSDAARPRIPAAAAARARRRRRGGLARDGTPLRAFADRGGIWRYPVRVEQVSPLYLQALLNYEDRWFWKHPGINPLALLRAGGQWLRSGRVVSGGSTLTMQVARILDPHRHRARPGASSSNCRGRSQLEVHLSQARDPRALSQPRAVRRHRRRRRSRELGLSGQAGSRLSHAEAALLTVLPQSPSRLRPDREPERARVARDKVLTPHGDAGRVVARRTFAMRASNR